MPTLGLLNIAADARVSWARANRMCSLENVDDGHQLIIEVNLKSESVSHFFGNVNYMVVKN
jgi:hypothetical protein